MEKEIQDPTKSEERKESACEKETREVAQEKYKNGTKRLGVEGKRDGRQPRMGKESGWAARPAAVKGTVWRLRSLSKLVAGAITVY